MSASDLPGALRRVPLGRFCVRLVFTLALLTVTTAKRAFAGVPLETAVKASYLYKFAPFVQWPPRAFASASSPLHICVIGADPFERTLEAVVRGQQVQGRDIAIVHMDSLNAQSAASCHILFVGKPVGQSTGDALHAAEGLPVLTVTDMSQGVSGGMIQFVLRHGRVRFTIDAAAAGAAGVQISSKLLTLAVRG